MKLHLAVLTHGSHDKSYAGIFMVKEDNTKAAHDRLVKGRSRVVTERIAEVVSYPKDREGSPALDFLLSQYQAFEAERLSGSTSEYPHPKSDFGKIFSSFLFSCFHLGQLGLHDERPQVVRSEAIPVLFDGFTVRNLEAVVRNTSVGIELLFLVEDSPDTEVCKETDQDRCLASLTLKSSGPAMEVFSVLPRVVVAGSSLALELEAIGNCCYDLGMRYQASKYDLLGPYYRYTVKK